MEWSQKEGDHLRTSNCIGLFVTPMGGIVRCMMLWKSIIKHSLLERLDVLVHMT